jgi:hypothetical protein
MLPYSSIMLQTEVMVMVISIGKKAMVATDTK